MSWAGCGGIPWLRLSSPAHVIFTRRRRRTYIGGKKRVPRREIRGYKNGKKERKKKACVQGKQEIASYALEARKAARNENEGNTPFNEEVAIHSN